MPPFPSAPLSEQGANSHDWPRATAQEEAARRRAEFEAQEAQRAADLEANLDQANTESQARRSNPPLGTGLDADVELLLRKRRELAEEAEIIDRILTKKVPGGQLHIPAGALPPGVTYAPPSPPWPNPPGMGPGVTLAQPFSPPRPGVTLIDTHFKKLSPPKPWTGVFSRRKLEDWIESAAGYLASHGVTHDYWLNKDSTPSAYYAMRSLFSAESKNSSSISPLSWFTNWLRNQPTAYHRYRQAKQGSLKVVEFASHLQSLASDCVDFSIGDDDLRDTFFYGLTTVARNYVRGILASREALTGVKTKLSFSQLVSISSHFDALEATTTSASSSLPRSSHTSTTPTPSRNPKPSALAPSPSPATPSPAQGPRINSWVDQASAWQAQNPMSKKSDWFRPNARRLYKPVKCYNCAALGDHLSAACPNSRKDPRTVVVAAVRPSLSSSAPVASSPASAAPAAAHLSAASADESESSGNAEGEEA
ncbi:hypothetical protein JCM11641_002486 [Rhodosporidiobolus odoratus]